MPLLSTTITLVDVLLNLSITHPMHIYVTGIMKPANEANSNSAFNNNNVASIPLTKHFIQVDTLAPHNCLAGLQYPFGLIIFSHKPLNIDSYTSLASYMMPHILTKFLTLFDHSVYSIKQFLDKPIPSNTRNTVKYQPPSTTSSSDHSGLSYSNLTGNLFNIFNNI